MLVPKNATSVRFPILLQSNAPVTPITGVAFDDEDLVLEILRPSDADWVDVTPVAGSATWVANGWRERGGGVYEWCVSNDYIVANETVAVRSKHGANNYRYDSISARLPVIDSAATTAIANAVVLAISSANATESLDSAAELSASRQWPTLDQTNGLAPYYYGDMWFIPFLDVTEPDGNNDIYITIKDGALADTDDDEAILHAVYDVSAETSELLFLNGEAATLGQSTKVTITVSEYTEGGETRTRIDMEVDDSITAEIPAGVYDLGCKFAGENSTTVDKRKIQIADPVTKTIDLAT